MPVEKLSRPLLYPCSGLLMKLEVTLGGKGYGDSRKTPLRTFTYSSKKYSSDSELTSITIDTNDFIILEATQFEGENTVAMSYLHLAKFVMTMEKVLKWFKIPEDEAEAEKYPFTELYLLDDNDDIFLNDKFKDLHETAYGMIFNKSISFYPDVIEFENELYEGVEMSFNNGQCYVSMTIDELEAFYFFLSRYNLDVSAMTLLSTSASILGDMLAENNVFEGSSDDVRGTKSRNANWGNRKKD